MRRLKPAPVPDELIWKLLDAAVKAPSGGNRQPWNFIVIRDAETKAKIAEWYLDGWNTAYGPFRQAAMAGPAIAKTHAPADRLANPPPRPRPRRPPHHRLPPPRGGGQTAPRHPRNRRVDGPHSHRLPRGQVRTPRAHSRRERHLLGEVGRDAGALGMSAVVR